MSQVRGRPFAPGNHFGRGRPKGSRNKRSAQAQAILDQYLEPLIKKCVGEALKGDVRALGLCLERILPALRDPGVRLGLPQVNSLDQLELAEQRLLRAIANGNVTPAEGDKIAAILDNHRRVLESKQLERRIEELEKRDKKK